MDYAHEYAAAKALAEERLNGLFRAGGLEEAMRYSLLAGGKRVRPVLALKFCQACGAPMEAALDFACAVELIHTYCLIHDDLPCIDNDDFRRGRPTNHRVYGESTAIIAGDALQSAAFGLIAGAGRNVAPERLGAVTEAVRVLAEAAGERGMCLGQFRDTTVPESERNEAVLTDINRGGQSIVMVTHDIKSARRADRIIYIQDGGIMGECILGRYQSGDKKRHEKIRAFLEDMGW